MKTEHRADLPCRLDCPFYGGKFDRTLRPCVAKVEKDEEEKCIEQIKSHFSSFTSGKLTLKPEGKRISILSENLQIGVVANGVAVVVKPQS